MDAPLVFVRVKRKRVEEPADQIVLGVSRKVLRVGESVDALAAIIARSDINGDNKDREVNERDITPTPVQGASAFVFRRVAHDNSADGTSRAVPFSARMLARIQRTLQPKLSVITGGASRRDKKLSSIAEKARQSAYDAHRKKAAGSGASAPTQPIAIQEPAAAVRVFDLLRGAGSLEGGAKMVRRYRMAGSTEVLAARACFVPASKAVPNRILPPLERRMDEAVWRAFREGNFGPVFEALRDGCNVNYQRGQSDLTTALHAAAFHGNVRVITTLLRRGAFARVPDATGRTALEWAQHAEHVSVATMLRDVLHGESEEIAAYFGNSATPASGDLGEDMGDTEFDLYVLSGEQGEMGACAGGTSAAGIDSEAVYELDPLEAAALASVARPRVTGMDVTGEDEDDLFEWRLPGEEALPEGDGSDVDDEDSNCEDAAGNDYPEEGDGDDYSAGAGSDAESEDWTYYGGTKGVQKMPGLHDGSSDEEGDGDDEQQGL